MFPQHKIYHKFWKAWYAIVFYVSINNIWWTVLTLLLIILKYVFQDAVYMLSIYNSWNIARLLNAVTLAPRAVPVPDRAPTQKSRRSRMHLLHKAIASKVKARITAPKQSLELNMSLVANGTRILTYTGSGDPGVPGRSPTGSRRIARATVTVARNLRRKGKCGKSVWARIRRIRRLDTV